MPRSPSTVPTDGELAILRVMWEHGPSSVRAIHNHLAKEREDQGRETGYSTTLKMIQVMTEKGLVLKDESQRPQIYRPAQREEQTQLQLVDNLIQRGFGGSAMKLVLRAVSANRVSTAEIAAIKKLLAQARGKTL